MNHKGNDGSERVTLLGPKSVLKGDFATAEELVILGELDGARVQSPNITIGPTARVRAEIHAGKVRIEGRVIGDIHAKVSVIVQATATVDGDIYSPEITIKEGATINGAVNQDPRPAAEKAKAAAHTRRVRTARSA